MYNRIRSLFIYINHIHILHTKSIPQFLKLGQFDMIDNSYLLKSVTKISLKYTFIMYILNG